MTNRWTAGPFGLTMFLQWSVGNKIYNINRAILIQNQGTGNQLVDVLHAGQDGVPVANASNKGFQTRRRTCSSKTAPTCAARTSGSTSTCLDRGCAPRDSAA